MTDESTIDDRAESLANQFANHLDVSAGSIADDMRTLIDEYDLPADEAERSVQNTLADEAGIERAELFEGSTTIGAGEIDDDELWVDLEVEVVSLWDASDSMAQQGLIGDQTGVIRFVAWDDAGAPRVEEGDTVRLTNVVTSEYQGDFSVKITSASGVEFIDKDIEVDDTESVSGVLVDIQDGSGLVKRCTETDDCTRVLHNGRCAEHGQQDGEFDLRIKAIVDDGQTAQNVLFDADATEALTGISLEDAKQLVRDELDKQAVAEQFDPHVGDRLELSGPTFNDLLLVETIEQGDPPSADAVLTQGRELDAPEIGV